METFRTGAIGALLDEYEKAIKELQYILNDITTSELTTIVDSKTNDPDCKSIQAVLSHVISAGLNYVNEIRRSLGEDIEFSTAELLTTSRAYQEALKIMFQYNVNLFETYPSLKIEELDNQKKILVRWKQLYDTEQLFEHAIVHILRHRRQVERFLITLRS